MDDKAFADVAEKLRRLSTEQLRELRAVLEQAEMRVLDGTIVEIKGEPIDFSMSVGTGTTEVVPVAGTTFGFSCKADYTPPGRSARDLLTIVTPYLRTASDIIRIVGFVKDLLE